MDDNASASDDHLSPVAAALAEMVGAGTSVVLIGDDPTGVAAHLSSEGCDVRGVVRADSLFGSDSDRDASSSVRAGDRHDPSLEAVVLLDVLDRVDSPESLLESVLATSGPQARLFVTVRNAAHGTARLALLAGRPADGSDRAPGAKAFTSTSLQSLLRRSGFVVDQVRATVVDVADGSHPAPEGLPPGVVEWVRGQPDALFHQLIVAAHLDHAAAPGSPAVPVVAIPSAAAHGIGVPQIAESETLVDLRHRLLTLRDHVLGLEAAAAAGRSQLAEASRTETVLIRRLRKKNETIRQLRNQIEADRGRARAVDGPGDRPASARRGLRDRIAGRD